MVSVNRPVKPELDHVEAAVFFPPPTKFGTVQYAGGGGGVPDPRERLLRNGMTKDDVSGTSFAKAGANAKSIL